MVVGTCHSRIGRFVSPRFPAYVCMRVYIWRLCKFARQTCRNDLAWLLMSVQETDTWFRPRVCLMKRCFFALQIHASCLVE